MPEYFKGLKNSYRDYLIKHPFHIGLGVDINGCKAIEEKIVKDKFFSVNKDLKDPLPAELDDLIRLHYLVTSRKVCTILEFGVGKSSYVFDHALEENKLNYSKYIDENIRKVNKFECHSVDNNKEWISLTKNKYKTNNVTYFFSDCMVTSFNGRVSTQYDNLPNICPDLIYLDGPDQYSPKGSVNGIHTRSADRLPMSADILIMEHFLLPGTLIVVDGRSANARFLLSNLQRNWSYFYVEKYDQHFFELCENPLGIYNKKQIDFCLGSEFYERIDKSL
jgi:hypothetical protein